MNRRSALASLLLAPFAALARHATPPPLLPVAAVPLLSEAQGFGPYVIMYDAQKWGEYLDAEFSPEQNSLKNLVESHKPYELTRNSFPV